MTNSPQSNPPSEEGGVTASALLAELNVHLRQLGSKDFSQWEAVDELRKLFDPAAESNPVASVVHYIKGLADDQVFEPGEQILEILDVATNPRPSGADISNNAYANYDAVKIPQDQVDELRRAIADITQESLEPFQDDEKK